MRLRRRCRSEGFVSRERDEGVDDLFKVFGEMGEDE